jgi:non-ribosomal peptide synthase protein (TIGR01720 family)
MVQVVWLDSGPGAQSWLLFVAHHLVIDGVSWRVLLPDLALAHAMVKAGAAEAAVPPAETSFRRWAGGLETLARSQETVGELPAWTDMLSAADPPFGVRALDPAVDTVAAGFSRQVLEIPAGLAGALVTSVPEAFHAGVEDVLVAGFAAAVCEWLRVRGRLGEDGVLVDREGHGRIPLTADMDLTRTVGWFTTMHPVRLRPGMVDGAEVRAGGADAGRLIKRVKEQLRAVPGNGLGYGLLRHLNPATGPVLAGLSVPQIGFNYMGRFGGSAPGGPAGEDAVRAPRFWTPADDEALRGAIDPGMPLRHALEVNGSARDTPEGPEMRFVLEAPAGVLSEAELGELAADWLAVLRGFVAHIGTAEGLAGGHTPSDFALVALGQDEIDEFESAV